MMDENSAGCASEADAREKIAALLHDAQVDRRFSERQSWATAHPDVRAVFLERADAALSTLPAPTISQDVPAPAAVRGSFDGGKTWQAVTVCTTAGPFPPEGSPIADVIDCIDRRLQLLGKPGHYHSWADVTMIERLTAALSAATPLQSDLAALRRAFQAGRDSKELASENRWNADAAWWAYRDAALQGADNHE